MARIYTYGELKESKLIYDRKPPAFGVIITLICLIFVSGIVILAAFSQKTYIVKASGMAVSENKTNIMNSVSGEVKAVYVAEGQAVDKGDRIFEIDAFQTELQIAQLTENANYINGKIGTAERLIAFVNGITLADDTTLHNPFDIANSDETRAHSAAQMIIDYVNQQIEAATEEQPFTQASIDSLKSSYLSEHYQTLDELRGQKINYDSQIKMYTDSLSEYITCANTSGIVHFNAALTVGSVIQAGSLIGTVSGSEKGEWYFDSVISATERSKLNIDDSAEIALTGVLQTEFGVISGKVIHIDNDSVQTENGEVFYRIKVKPDNTVLESKKGEKVVLSLGMVAECRIKYDETTWLKWAIEQIGVKFR
jgi:multidrug resistance efflux pump